jgi:hypothetical protein
MLTLHTGLTHKVAGLGVYAYHSLTAPCTAPLTGAPVLPFKEFCCGSPRHTPFPIPPPPSSLLHSKLFSVPTVHSLIIVRTEVNRGSQYTLELPTKWLAQVSTRTIYSLHLAPHLSPALLCSRLKSAVAVRLDTPFLILPPPSSLLHSKLFSSGTFSECLVSSDCLSEPDACTSHADLC